MVFIMINLLKYILYTIGSVDKIVAEFQKIKEQLNGMKVNPATTEVTTNP
jgi:hypothetical protein